MTETYRFIRFVLSGALTLTGLLAPAGAALATPAGQPAATAGHTVPTPARADGSGPGAGTGGGPRPATGPRPTTGAGTGTGIGTGTGTGAGSDPLGVTDPSAPEDAQAAPHVFTGTGFDTCQAPDLDTMTAWLAGSPYGAAGIYFGGRARACTSQANLTPDWVRRTTADGWSLLPIYVGSQSPCVSGSNKNPYLIDTKDPTSQGTSEGQDAVSAAGALGLQPGSALYLDMEAYDYDDSSCAATTLAFVQAWDRALRAAGYLSGFYSSADSGVRHMELSRLAGAADLPDAVWYARWGVTPTLTSEPSLAVDAWAPHARLHQYSGSVTETYGGRTLNIDRDLIDAPVAVVG